MHHLTFEFSFFIFISLLISQSQRFLWGHLGRRQLLLRIFAFKLAWQDVGG